MKKILVILLAFLYLSISSGIVYNIHYCMGEVANVEIGSKLGEKCAQCGMDNNGCCHDDIHVIKLKDDHSLVSNQISFAKITPIVVDQFVFNTIVQSEKITGKYISSKPPPLQTDRNTMYCVFRI